jgi:SAM-dependent methyltransferase
MEQFVYEEMFSVEETHWWFVSKRKIVMYLIQKMLPRINVKREDCQIADLGCGCGATLKILSQEYHVSGMDSSNHAIEFCRQKGLEIQKGELPYDVPYHENKLDVVLLLDVIEHIEEDAETIKKAFSLLKPGGILICTAPAYQWLWSMHDETHHHKKRYNKKDFRRLFSLPSGVTIVCNYYNTFLFSLALIDRLTYKFLDGKRRKTGVSYLPKILNTLFEKIFSLERFFLLRVRFPFGLSLIGVLQKATPLR